MMLRNKAKELIGGDDKFEMSFQDLENDKIDIIDEHDWDYLVSNVE